MTRLSSLVLMVMACLKVDLVIKFVAAYSPAQDYSVTFRATSNTLPYLQPKAQGLIYGAPGGIRIPCLLVRSQTLYPTELRAQTFTSILQDGPRGSIRTSDPLVPGQVRYQAALHTDKTLVPTIRIERIWLAFQTRAMTTLAQSAKSSAFVIAAHSLSLKTSWRPSEKSKLTVSELRQ